MESNLEDNITQSQSQENPPSTQGNSRRKKILCKKHETGRKGQSKVNSSEDTTLQQQYEKGEISFQELCKAIVNRKSNVERFFENDIEDDIEDDINTINNVNNQNRNDNDKNKDNNDNTHDNVNANNNDNGNDNDDNNDVQQVFPPQNPHLPLSNPNPPYIPPEQPKD